MQADEAYALLGCSASDSDGSVRQCFLRAAVREHPDKKPEGLERQAAETRFQQFRSAFDSVMQARSKLAKTAEAMSPAKAHQELYGEQGVQSSFAPHSLSSSFASSFTAGPSTSGIQSHPGSAPHFASRSSSGVPMSLASAASQGTTMTLLSSQASTACSTPASTAAAVVARLAGIKRHAPASHASAPQMEQALSLSLEELYSGCVKRMLVSRRVYDSTTATQRPMQEVLEVTVAPGWREGTRVTFHGKGDFHPGSTPADLVFVVREELHPRYERRGNDLITRVNLPLVTALTGGRVELSLLDQRVMSLPIADVVSPHCERVIQGEGMPITRTPGKRGNLIVHFDISFPRTLSPLQKCLIRTAFAEPPPDAGCADDDADGDQCSGCPLPASEVMDEAVAGAAVAAARAVIMSTLNGLYSKSIRMLT